MPSAVRKNYHPSLEKIHRAIDENFNRHLEQCREFLRQKSISVTGEGIRDTAEKIRRIIEDMGGEAAFWGNPDFPVIFGKLNANAPKTLIIYGMYDVQPADEENWKSPPFAAEIYRKRGVGDCVIARGAFNSKGVLSGVFNVLETIRECDRLPVNILLTIEGEEEIGSPQFESFIRAHQEELKGTGVVDFDFLQDRKGKVAMKLGLKGIVCMDLICRGGEKGGPIQSSLHGEHGAWISSPAWRLVHALSTLTDRKENIQITGLQENADPPDKQDLKLLRKLAMTFDEKAFLKEMKSVCFKCDLHGVDLLKKGLYSPIINIDGLITGYTGPGTKTVLPRKATAKIDIRFGPRIEPEEIVEKFKRHLADHGYGDIEVIVRDCYPWAKTDFSEPLARHLLGAYRYHDVEPEIWPMSTGAAPYFAFQRVLGLPVVYGGLGHGGRAHVANEYMAVKGLLDFEKFVATLLYLTADNPAS